MGPDRDTSTAAPAEAAATGAPRVAQVSPQAPTALPALLTSGDAQWDALARRSRNVFATAEWLSLWWRHFGGDNEPLVAIKRGPGGVAVAGLPLYRCSRRGLRMLRFVGHGPGDQLGPVCAPEDEHAAGEALREFIAHVPDWDVLQAELLPGPSDWARVLGGIERRRESSPSLALTGLSWDGYLASRSPNFRQQVRRRERNLARDHELTFRLADDPAHLDADMETLFHLHRERWAGDGLGAMHGKRASFHREFAALALERGWLRLWFLELDGRPAAAWYGLRFGGVESFYQSGRDRSDESGSVGFVLLAHTIRKAIEDGCAEYRFLRGGEAYKSRFATTDAGLQTVLVPRTLRGRGAVGALPLARTLRSGVNRLRRGALRR